MARAFTNVEQVRVFADRLAAYGEDGAAAARDVIADVAEGARQVQRARVPVDTGETRDSIRVRPGPDGLSATIGPTNRDKKGRPVGFFIEYGTGKSGPRPFVRPSAKWAAKALPDAMADAVARMIQGR